MPIPAASQPDYIALAMVVVLLAFVAVLTVRKYLRSKRVATPAPMPVPAEDREPLPVAPGAAGQVKLHNVEPKIAAMAMAIVADTLGKPLNELRFISIREVEDK